MCGITGVVGTRSPTAVAMRDALVHRGPDCSDSFRTADIEFGITRLAIVDPHSQVGILSNEDNTIFLAFNGEIYNHCKLREELVALGHQFRTKTDSEVVVHLYEQFGENFLERLDGMFALALCDGNEVYLARDPLGIKPLHYTVLPGSSAIVFASEIKALLKNPEVSPSIDEFALGDLSVLNHLAGTNTLFTNIRTLAPGHLLRIRVKNGRTIAEKPRSFYPPQVSRDRFTSVQEAEIQLLKHLENAILTHIPDDCNWGVALSGGLDSAILASLCKRNFEQSGSRNVLRTFTISDHPNHPDALVASDYARSLGADHSLSHIRLEDYLEYIPQYVRAEEQPSRLYGLPFFLLCKTMSKEITVCLHGDGADELFGGYLPYMDPRPRFDYVQRRLEILKTGGMSMTPAGNSLVQQIHETLGKEGLCAQFRHQLGAPLERQHLDHVDRCSMAFGIESRVPYLDRHVVQFAERLPADVLVRRDLGIRKYLLRRLGLQLLGSNAVDIVLREKHGAPSAGNRLLGRLELLCQDTLPDSFQNQHRYGRLFQNKFQLLMLDLFETIFVTYRGDASQIGSFHDFLLSRAGSATSVLKSSPSSLC